MSLIAAAAVGTAVAWHALKVKPEAGANAAASAPASAAGRSPFPEVEAGEVEFTPAVDSPGETRQPERVIGEAPMLVGDGETVMTEGYESAPGEFVFSSLTPTLKTMPDGTTAVQLEAKGFKITVSGDVDANFEQRSARTVEVKPGGAVTMATITDDGVYSLSATVSLDDLPLIRLQATGAKTAPPPGRPR